jgi:hypothetical protein
MISLTLPISLADFNTSVQQTFKETMAVAAGLTKADSWRVTLTVRSARRAGGVAINVVIDMPNSALANAAVSSLSQGKINTLLTAAGLPTAIVTSAAAVTGQGGPLSALGIRMRHQHIFLLVSSVAMMGLTLGHSVCGH